MNHNRDIKIVKSEGHMVSSKGRHTLRRLWSKKEFDATLELIMDSDNGDTLADNRPDASEDVPATPAPLNLKRPYRTN